MNRRYSPDDVAAVLDDYVAGLLSYAEITAKHGPSDAMIRIWAEAAGLPKRTTGRKPVHDPVELEGGAWVNDGGVMRWHED